jgi:hypothetical protein
MVVGLALIALGATASLARADDSQIRISEVYSDASANKTDFVELQLLADGQSIPAGAAVRLCNATASACVNFSFSSQIDLPASLSQRTILLGWDTNPNADLQVGASLNPPPLGGSVCYYQSLSPAIPIDCVAWGTSTGAVPSVGSPAPALNATESLTRTEARGCSSLMEAVDDSDNSATDFFLTSPTPRNNLQTPTEAPCPPAISPVPTTTTTTTKRKCKKKKRHASAVVAKKRCKKHKK